MNPDIETNINKDEDGNIMMFGFNADPLSDIIEKSQDLNKHNHKCEFKGCNEPAATYTMGTYAEGYLCKEHSDYVGNQDIYFNEDYNLVTFNELPEDEQKEILEYQKLVKEAKKDNNIH